MANVVAGELLLFPENKKVEVFETPADLVYNKFNALFAHLFSTLANSHSMSLFHVSPGKGSTVQKIVNDTFPAIRATNDKVGQAYPNGNFQDGLLHPRPRHRHTDLSFC